MAFGDSVDLLFKIKADSGDAEAELKKLSNIIDRETGNAEQAASGNFSKIGATLSSVAGPAAAAAAGIATIATAAISVGSTLFNLAKQASDFGSEIFDASQKTGLSAETLSSLKFAADQSGASLEAVTGATAKFSKTVGDAARGSEEASAKLKEFGISPTEAIKDLDGALGKVFTRIAELPPGIQQMTAAQDAFGRSGADLLPFIRSFDGDMAGLIATAKRLGVTLTDEDAAAADEFGDSLDTLTAQASGIGRTFANEFMPQITSAMKDVSRAFEGNQSIVEQWGRAVGTAIGNTVQTIKGLSAILKGETGSATLNFFAKMLDYLIQINTYLPRVLGEKIREQAPQRVTDPLADVSLKPLSARENQIFGNKVADVNTEIFNSRKKVKETGAAIEKEMRKTFEDLGFHVNRTFGKAINAGSLHPSGKAIDIAHQGKSSDEIVNAIAVGLSKGWQLVDERLKRPGINQSGPHIHFEKDAGVQPSSFLPASFYGGQANLDYLKKVDRDRLNKRTSTDDVAAFQKDLAKQEEDRVRKIEQANERVVKNREQTDARILQIASASAEQEQAIYENMFARRQISEREYIELKNKSETDLLTRERDLLDERLQLKELTSDERAELEAKIAELEAKLQTTVVRQQTADEQRFNDASERFAAELEAHLERQYQLEQDILAIRRETLEIERGITAFRNAQNLKILANVADSSTGKARIEALRELGAAQIAEELRLQRERETILNEQEQAEKRRAESEIEDAETRTATIEAIEENYRRRKEESEAEHFERISKIRKGNNADIKDAQPAGVGGLADVASEGLGGLFGLEGTEELKLMGPLADSITNSFRQMAQAVGESVKAFVLFGTAGGSFKKFAAELIASIAQMAAVEAVWNLAQGFAKLALAYFGYAPAGPSATAHFAAAAIYGGIAGIAAIAGREVAGNSFKQQTGAGAATGGGTSQGVGGSGSRSSGGVSGANDNRITEINRNTAPQRVEHVVRLQVQSNDSHIVKTVTDDYEKRGAIHGLILNVVEGT